MCVCVCVCVTTINQHYRQRDGVMDRQMSTLCRLEAKCWLSAHKSQHAALHTVISQKSYVYPPKKEVLFLVRSVCLSVCPSDYSQTCERILTKFFGGVGHGSRTKWYNFGGDPDRASDPVVQSPKSGSSGSAEVCVLWAYLVVRTIQ